MLPIAIGVIEINGVDPTALLLTVGLLYIGAGAYFRIPVPVQPMKVIGAYAIAAAVTPLQISTSAVLTGVLLLALGAFGIVDLAGRLIPKPAVRGVQLATGVLLMAEGIRFMLGESQLQRMHGAAEPFLRYASVATVPLGIVLGVASLGAVMFLLDSRKLPAGLVVVVGGAAVGLGLGGYAGLGDIRPGLHFPSLLPYGFPGAADLAFVTLALVLPQLPMTFGNAIVAEADLSREYLGERASRVGFRSLAVSMGFANLVVGAVGGMPLCHGAGGLAAHYRFGARTAGSNLTIGGLFLVFALLLGDDSERLLRLLPFSVLGALLVFAGAQLALMVRDMKEKTDMFVAISVLGVALVTNVGVGFAIGVALAYAFSRSWLKI
jgi:SulP family sulfate permease